MQALRKYEFLSLSYNYLLCYVYVKTPMSYVTIG